MPASDTRAERLWIDWTACDGRGLCAELLPELLSRDPWGYPLPRDGTGAPIVPGAPTVPGELAGHARRAVAACPALALRLLRPPAGCSRPPLDGPSRPRAPRGRRPRHARTGRIPPRDRSTVDAQPGHNPGSAAGPTV